MKKLRCWTKLIFFLQSIYIQGQVIILELTTKEQDIVPKVRELIGATDPAMAKRNTIRGVHGLDSLSQARAENRMLRNLVHASDSNENAAKELKLWFK